MMFKKNITYIFIVLSLMITWSCSEYQRVQKSTDVEYKYQMAVKYYEKEDYIKAYPLFEELLPLMRGTQQAEMLNYYYCYCNYHLADYVMASYHFSKFSRTFPNSKYVEETRFMSAYCNYRNSPVYSLDQTNTYQAITDFRRFISLYPNSQLKDSAQTLKNELEAKLEEKAKENALQYYKTEDYKSAIVAMNNFLQDYPTSEHAEKMTYYIFRSSFLLAINSVEKKKEERLDNAIDAYYNFVDNFNKSEYLAEAENLYTKLLSTKEEFYQLITEK